MSIRDSNRPATMHIHLAGVVVCLVATVTAYYAGVHPVVEQRSIVNAQKKELKIQRHKATTLKALTQELADQLTAVTEELARTRIPLLSSTKVNTRVADLTALLSDSRLEVDDVKIGKTAEGSRCSIVPIDIAGRGGCGECAAFLHYLHEAFPDTGIAAVELTGDPSRPQKPRNFSFELLWHTAANELLPRS